MTLLILNRNRVESDRVYKYHESQEGFKDEDVRKIQCAIRRSWGFASNSAHFESAVSTDYHRYYVDSLDYILRYGKCFEYKLVNNKYLFRMAIKVYHKHFDIVYVIEPKYYNNIVTIELITSYTNNKGDTHSTLNTNNYDTASTNLVLTLPHVNDKK